VAPEELTIGVEEEFLLVDPDSRRLVPSAREVLEAVEHDSAPPRVEHELQLCQIETETEVCHTLDEVRAAIVRLRRDATAAAEKVGCRIASAGTH
jgi:carboxylate-amine ligase